MEKINRVNKVYQDYRTINQNLTPEGNLFKEEQKNKLKFEVDKILKEYLEVAHYNPVVNEKELFSTITVASFPKEYTSLAQHEELTTHLKTVVEKLFEIEDPILKIAVFCFINDKGIELTDDLRYNFIASLKNISDEQIGVQHWLSILNSVHPDNYSQYVELFKEFEYLFVEYAFDENSAVKYGYLTEMLRIYRMKGYSKLTDF